MASASVSGLSNWEWSCRLDSLRAIVLFQVIDCCNLSKVKQDS